MCKEPVHFLLLCIESYKFEHNMTGGDVMNLFDDCGAVDFIIKFHDVLHIESPQAIVHQIDDFISAAKRADTTQSISTNTVPARA
ncbi:MAG: DUF3791 domain-containing protein [Treponema sp.]|jgi:hypothetical protein|nr:DUF3791 domain-containing protein [Treponema sp.]